MSTFFFLARARARHFGCTRLHGKCAVALLPRMEEGARRDLRYEYGRNSKCKAQNTKYRYKYKYKYIRIRTARRLYSTVGPRPRFSNFTDATVAFFANRQTTNILLAKRKLRWRGWWQRRGFGSARRYSAMDTRLRRWPSSTTKRVCRVRVARGRVVFRLFLSYLYTRKDATLPLLRTYARTHTLTRPPYSAR